MINISIHNWRLKAKKEEHFYYVAPIEFLVGRNGFALFIGGPYLYLNTLVNKSGRIEQRVRAHNSKLFTGIRYYFQSKENPFWEYLDSYKSMAFVNRQRKCICLLRYKYQCLADAIKAYPKLLSDAKSLKDYESKILEKINNIF
jgi:hypothetical protein